MDVAFWDFIVQWWALSWCHSALETFQLLHLAYAKLLSFRHLKLLTLFIVLCIRLLPLPCFLWKDEPGVGPLCQYSVYHPSCEQKQDMSGVVGGCSFIVYKMWRCGPIQFIRWHFQHLQAQILKIIIISTWLDHYNLLHYLLQPQWHFIHSIIEVSHLQLMLPCNLTWLTWFFKFHCLSRSQKKSQVLNFGTQLCHLRNWPSEMCRKRSFCKFSVTYNS